MNLDKETPFAIIPPMTEVLVTLSEEVQADFYIEDGISFRRDALGNWVSMLDSAQPNPFYRPNPGIHGWVRGESGLERIDIKPGEEIPVQTAPEVILYE